MKTWTILFINSLLGLIVILSGCNRFEDISAGGAFEIMLKGKTVHVYERIDLLGFDPDKTIYPEKVACFYDGKIFSEYWEVLTVSLQNDGRYMFIDASAPTSEEETDFYDPTKKGEFCTTVGYYSNLDDKVSFRFFYNFIFNRKTSRMKIRILNWHGNEFEVDLPFEKFIFQKGQIQRVKPK